MIERLIRSKGLWLALTLSVLSVLAGCSSNTPLGPDTDDSASLGRCIQGDTYRYWAAPCCDVILPAAADAVEVTLPITAAAGGVIAIQSEGYNHAFVVEPGGLNEDKVISVKADRTFIWGRRAVEFEFGPDGLVFNVPSKLEFDMAEINPRVWTAKLYYFDPRVGRWVLQGETRVVRGMAVFEIYHFSRYAISD